MIPSLAVPIWLVTDRFFDKNNENHHANVGYRYGTVFLSIMAVFLNIFDDFVVLDAMIPSLAVLFWFVTDQFFDENNENQQSNNGYRYRTGSLLMISVFLRYRNSSPSRRCPDYRRRRFIRQRVLSIVFCLFVCLFVFSSVAEKGNGDGLCLISMSAGGIVSFLFFYR